ncbi:MAG: aldo/keto reductase [Chloroflexi bacterium]|nr:aldo/keto reductase [Chloroflexota bacterium]OJV94820.1 MAG: aldo/keto reductase [Chloroflexi bacterium 54-19]
MIAKMNFGKTGHESTRIIFGAAALGNVSQDDADRTLEVLFQYGINHIDTAASYGDSEIRIGPWMPQHRDKFFLATKTGDRSYKEAKDSIHRSLDRLKTDKLDLIQLHNLADVIEWQTAMGPGGALEACVEAREQGLVRFIGVTGHGLSIAAMHLRSLGAFDFDSVLLPYNYVTYQKEKYQADFEALLKTAKEKNVAVQTIKSIARRPWGLEAHHTANTWYEPLTEQADIDKAVQWVLSNPQVFLNTAGDIHILPKVLEAASKADYNLPQSEVAISELAAEREMASLFV